MEYFSKSFLKRKKEGKKDLKRIVETSLKVFNKIFNCSLLFHQLT